MKKMKKLAYFPIFIALTVLSTGCGGQAYSTGAQKPGAATTSGGTLGAVAPSYPVLGASIGSDTPTSSPSTNTGTSPAIRRSFTLQGTSAANPPNYPFIPNKPASITYANISSDTRLVVDLLGDSLIQAQYANSSISTSYVGTVIYASCIQVKIQVLDHLTQQQIGSDRLISANTKSSDGSGSCGSVTASPSYDFSGDVLSSGHGTIDIVVSQIYADVYYNSSLGGTLYSHTLQLLPYNWIASGTLIIHTDTTQ